MAEKFYLHVLIMQMSLNVASEIVTKNQCYVSDVFCAQQ